MKLNFIIINSERGDIDENTELIYTHDNGDEESCKIQYGKRKEDKNSDLFDDDYLGFITLKNNSMFLATVNGHLINEKIRIKGSRKKRKVKTKEMESIEKHVLKVFRQIKNKNITNDEPSRINDEKRPGSSEQSTI